jgi:hypothetical protein
MIGKTETIKWKKKDQWKSRGKKTPQFVWKRRLYSGNLCIYNVSRTFNTSSSALRVMWMIIFVPYVNIAAYIWKWSELLFLVKKFGFEGMRKGEEERKWRWGIGNSEEGKGEEKMKEWGRDHQSLNMIFWYKGHLSPDF